MLVKGMGGEDPGMESPVYSKLGRKAQGDPRSVIPRCGLAPSVAKHLGGG